MLWGMACWAFFQVFYSYHFFYQEQNQLFLLSHDYLATYFRKPGWAVCLAGDFLTQFFYYRYVGAAILTATLLVMGDLLCRAFGLIRKGVWGYWTAMILMTIEACLFFHHDHRVSSAMAIIGGTILFLVYALTSKRMPPIIRVAFGICLGLVAYTAADYGWIIYTLFVIIHDGV